MRAGKLLMAAVLLLGTAACQKDQKVSPQEMAIVNQTTAQENAADAAVAHSRYSTYRWMTPEEMVNSRLGYDPTMSENTRYTIEQAVDDDLSDKGFQEGQPADFVVAFSDVYIDRSRSSPGDPFDPFGGPGIEATGGTGQSTMEAYSDMEVYRTPEEGFRIMFFDASTHRLLWRGSGREHFASMDAKQNDEAIEVAVYHALDAMPVPLSQQSINSVPRATP